MQYIVDCLARLLTGFVRAHFFYPLYFYSIDFRVEVFGEQESLFAK